MYVPVKVTSSQVDFHKLRDNVEDVTLYLPRLSSPSQFDTFCSVDKTRFCTFNRNVIIIMYIFLVGERTK